jgi:hypothetical protein
VRVGPGNDTDTVWPFLAYLRGASMLLDCVVIEAQYAIDIGEKRRISEAQK